jgi:hypothetical protein
MPARPARFSVLPKRVVRRPAHTSVFLLAWLAAAQAQAATIVIVRPAGASVEVTETVSRLHGELLSLGLDVAFAARPAGPPPSSEPRARLEAIAAAHDADAVIDLITSPRPAAVDLYVLDRQTRRSELSHVALDAPAEDAPARLAIRTIEALRSSLLEHEIDLAARARSDPGGARVAPVVVAPAPPPPPGPPPRVELEAGAAILTGADGVGPALVPTVRVGWAAWPRLVLQATLAGLGTHPTLTAAAGSGRVAQQFGLVGICACAPSPRRLQLYVAVAAGALRTTIDGEADAPAAAHTVERWSFLLDGSAGARVRLPGRSFVTLAAHVQVAEPYVAVHIADTQVATSGRPNLLLTLTVGAWL